MFGSGVAILTAAHYCRNSIVVTSTFTTTEAPSQSPSEGTASGDGSVIPLSAVIGACIGTLIGATLLICLGVWFYRRSSRRPPPRARQMHPQAQSRGVDPSTPWTKFGDDEDKWEGRNGTSEKEDPFQVSLAPGVQRTSPQSRGRSLASNDHPGSQPGAAHEPQPFAHYHPKLAEEMALEPPRPIGVESQPKSSLDGSTTGTFLSLGTVHIESGKMSPTFNVAKMTPPATSSRLHQWESAEVVNPELYAQEVELHDDPFSDKSTPTNYSPTETFGDRRSFHNPFFNAQQGSHSRRPSTVRKASTVSVSSNPFDKDDEEIITMPKPKFVSHAAHESSSSGGSFGNEKAMQSLIAALDLPQEVIEERLRIASMQPSETSRYSTAMDSAVEYVMPIAETGEQAYATH